MYCGIFFANFKQKAYNVLANRAVVAIDVDPLTDESHCHTKGKPIVKDYHVSQSSLGKRH